MFVIPCACIIPTNMHCLELIYCMHLLIWSVDCPLVIVMLCHQCILFYTNGVNRIL